MAELIKEKDNTDQEEKTTLESSQALSEEQTETSPKTDSEKENEGLEETSEDALTDKHGQEAIAKGKYERDLAAKDKEIEELKAKVASAAETEEGRAKLSEEVDSLKGQLETLKLSYKLEALGCYSVKAATVLLEDYEGDVDKLKEGEPWLFQDFKPKGKTGLKPQGAADDAEARLAKARAELGLPEKK